VGGKECGLFFVLAPPAAAAASAAASAAGASGGGSHGGGGSSGGSGGSTTTPTTTTISVVGVERLAPLADAARGLLAASGGGGGSPLLPPGACATVVEGDGHVGWAAGAPYDAIHVGAAVSGGVPRALMEQLAPGGALVVPLVDEDEEEDEEEGAGAGAGGAGAQAEKSRRTQALWLFEKSEDGATVKRTRVMPVIYVPLVAETKEKQAARRRAAVN
jgi:protein-L-isoaspartate(D-aspartate) O-methyltransferase